MGLHVVTGGFGYTGKHIARELISQGERVRTLTNSLHRGNPFGNSIEVHPLDFADEEALVASLRDADVLYNTYWVRYDYQEGRRVFGYDLAVRNTRILFDAARRAGVRRVVHVSVANAEKSDWAYFRGKVELEDALRSSGLSYAIVRPTVVFGGPENVLINNIAWMLRRFPVFGSFGGGHYRLNPVHVDDVARICIDVGSRTDDVTVDAAGPETFTYREMLHLMAGAMGIRRLILPVSGSVALVIGKIVGVFVKDIVVTGHEIAGLRAELMYSQREPLGQIRFSEWLSVEADTLGRTYTNDLVRRR